MEQENKDWLKDVKAGDKIFRSWGRQPIEEVIVDKVTAGGNLRVKGDLYKNGEYHSNGSFPVRAKLFPRTPENVEQYEQRLTIRRAFRLMQDTTKLTYSQAVQIIEILVGVETNG